MSRTEEDKITQAGISVVFGDKTYEFRVLRKAEASPWRKEFSSWYSKLSKHTTFDSNNPKEFPIVVNYMMINLIDEISDLLFAYAKDLPRQEIEEIATEEEIIEAFGKVLEVAIRPLWPKLTKALGNIA